MSQPPGVQSMGTKMVRSQGRWPARDQQKMEDKGSRDDTAASECENTQATDHDGHLVAHPTLRLQHTCTPCGGWASWTDRRSCKIRGGVLFDISLIQANIISPRFSLSTS